MKLTVKTATLQAMVAKAMKGASCNKMIPITGMMCIQLWDNHLILITTDASNYLYISQSKIPGENFEITVDADVFSKLISRLTCDEISMTLEDNSLHIKGNGNYRIELPLDEEGQLVKFPNTVLAPTDWIDCGTINLSTVKLILTTARPSLAPNSPESDEGCYVGYYCGDRVVATNRDVMCGIDIKLWAEPALVSPEMMDILGVFTAEKITVKRRRNEILFCTDDCTLYGHLMDSVDDYQIDVINSLLDQEYDSVCGVSRSALLQLLDRLILFVSTYDKNTVDLTFTDDGISIQSKRANSVELIPYKSSENFNPFACSINVEYFRTQVKASTGDIIELHYGLDNAIKFVDGNVTQVIALE